MQDSRDLSDIIEQPLPLETAFTGPSPDTLYKKKKKKEEDLLMAFEQSESLIYAF